MKAIVLSIEHRNKLKALIATTPLTPTFRDGAIKWLTYGSKGVNPFDVFDQHEKEMIIEALATLGFGIPKGGTLRGG